MYARICVQDKYINKSSLHIRSVPIFVRTGVSQKPSLPLPPPPARFSCAPYFIFPTPPTPPPLFLRSVPLPLGCRRDSAALDRPQQPDAGRAASTSAAGAVPPPALPRLGISFRVSLVCYV